MPKPSLPQGTRDFSATVVRKRNHIFSVIRNVFELYGFEPLETPAMENLETLTGKYGDEGDKLIYRILDSGNPFDENFVSTFANVFAESNSLAQPNTSSLAQLNTSLLSNPLNPLFSEALKNYQNKLKNEITGKALKYDLTIPFARYVAMNHTKLTFPFRRYQIQPVWRADRPQKGRYREFYQCDADIVGSKNLLNEVELVYIYSTVFSKLGIEVQININNRKILQGIAEYCGCIEKLTDITTAIDKVYKIGREKVEEELIQKGIPKEKIKRIFDCVFIVASEDDLFTKDQLINDYSYSEEDANRHIEIQNSSYRTSIEILDCLYGQFYNDDDEPIKKPPITKIGMEGIDEVVEVFNYLHANNININLVFDPTLVRGLNYYTGAIFEVTANNVQLGSIGGGGRYDDLTGLFGVPGIPGVGISFGVDRIYDVMEELHLFPEDLQVNTRALFFNMGEKESIFAFGIMQQLRSKGIACEMYHEETKIAKQFSYAEKKNIPYAVIIGSKEISENNCQVKNLSAGIQETVALDELAVFFNNK